MWWDWITHKIWRPRDLGENFGQFGGIYEEDRIAEKNGRIVRSSRF
jgi:hypothetical protein